MHNARPPLEQIVAAEIADLLRSAPPGVDLALAPASPLCASLERFLPRLLEPADARWSGESFDGIFPVQTVKIDDRTLRTFGTCILISDQTVTPFHAELEVNQTGDAIQSYRLRVGEPGSGPLGVSGPPCNSGAATRLARRLAGRLDLSRVAWVYVVSSSGPEDGFEPAESP